MSPLQLGELRKSQAIHTFGIGATVDLPHLTVVTLGTDFWQRPQWDPTQAVNAIDEPRLLALVRSFLGPGVKQLTAPSTNPEATEAAAMHGVPVGVFPTWGRCPSCEMIAPYDLGHFHLAPNPNRHDDTKFVHKNCLEAKGKTIEVIPVRFVMACPNGHLADFPWIDFIKGGTNPCTCAQPGPLRLQERGVSAEVADLWLSCKGCDARRIMTQAFERDEKTGAYPALGSCRGHHPHFGRQHVSSCDAIARPMLLGASNQWFPLMVSALTIPGQAGQLAGLVESNWSILKGLPSFETFEFMYGQGSIPNVFGDVTPEEVWAEIERQRAGAGASESPSPTRAEELKVDEWSLFSDATNAPKTSDFELRTVDVPASLGPWIESLVQVPRLRVVKAMTGFTRIDSPGDYADIADIEPAKRVPLADGETTWVPAYEVRGEGIFLQIREDAIAAWRSKPEVQDREAQLRAAHRRFREVRNIDPVDDAADVLRYALLHSLSHALIRQFSIDCGYSSASIQERIYSMAPGDDSGAGPMAGILLMTAAADSEGTLGGLVALGEPTTFERHFRAALDRACLCSSDPLCSEHPILADGRTLHGAACHACMFVSETSCERANRLVDRALLVPTTGSAIDPFFGGLER